MLQRHFTLSAVLYEARDRVHAQCLELDVVCDAPNRFAVWKRVAEHVEVNLQMAEECGYKIPQADRKHWDAFRRGHLFFNPQSERMVLGDTVFLLHPNVRFVPTYR